MEQANQSDQNISSVKELQALYHELLGTITSRFQEFKHIWMYGSDEDIFAELVFCLLTPQCAPRPCWETVVRLRNSGLWYSGDKWALAAELACARFRYKKASYIATARNQFYDDNGVISIKSHLRRFNSIQKTRSWLVAHVKGFGYKEASHFLRNIGLAKNIAILDRHILKNLIIFGVIDEIPSCLNSARYCAIEVCMNRFAKTIDIPLDALDMVLWYKEKGEIFK